MASTSVSSNSVSSNSVVGCRKLGAWSLVGWVALAALLLGACGSSSDATADSGTDATSDATDSAAMAGVESDVADELQEAKDKLEEIADSEASGSGNGVVSIEGVDYSFEASICFAEEGYFEANGPGQTAEGVPFWASVSLGVQTRADMEAVMGEGDAVDMMFGDKDSMELFTLGVELGKDGMFGPGDDEMANFTLDLMNAEDSEEMDYVVDGNTFSGSGVVYDYNGIAIAFNETVPVEFSATCS